MVTIESNSKKSKAIIIGIIALLVIMTLGYYVRSQMGKGGVTPPFLHVPKQTLKGEIVSGDIICQIPGLYSFSDTEVSNYKKPADTTDADAKTLLEGIHIYHANQNMTVLQILQSITPTSGNKVMIAYYPSNNNSSANFSVYPTDLQGESKIITPGNFKIPANEGFIIFSCQKTTIYKVLDEQTDGDTSPTNFETDDTTTALTHWVLMSGWSDSPSKETLKKNFSKYYIKSVWVQNGPGFSFQKTDAKTLALTGDYRMVWVELQKNPKKGKNIISCEANCSASCTSGPYGEPVCTGNYLNPPTGSETGTGISSDQLHSQTVYYKSGSSGTGIPSGKTDHCNTTGGGYSYSGCLGQKAATSGSASGASGASGNSPQ